MPTLLIWHGYKFRFYSSDGAEPPHVHIVKGKLSAKVWLMSMEIAYNHGYNNREVAEFLARIDESRADWMEKWNEFFGI
ncbi:DUF4160 domain-containing protein [Agrobacterium rubi]|uniref:DUF4160 domain-containing protein n=1 Tax=Agrobacterium rubi TaxID=28099 RepID=A0AAE7UN16_9HYPH|nr:DUF4160 domain-containing protein [Agrobacterium rubi]NTE85198.1 DUF4160 domain-containing protein [Agrobacterium rubi]NTF01130.1 DUF4160 domain-containing protein [Agrobacterium rubi]NTF35318.1 DUF4160 domain-containing protein [Agrobacterium rubi]OCJ48665.1 hypothetical protein A6U92_11085 [Agrobacterium rubi]QTG00518.1 DUF4160 domain-containing protein [Agrobacterium rubi]